MLDRPGSIFKWWLHNEVYYLRTRGFIDKFQVNKIAARWPAKAVAQLFTFSKKGSDRIVPR